MRPAAVGVAWFLLVCTVSPGARQAAADLRPLLDRASAYVTGYEHAFSLLVSEEHYVQEIRRPDNPGANLSRSNPGGGIQAGGVRSRRVLRSDFLLVQLGPGAGWMPFRDVYAVDAFAVRDRADRLAQLFLSNDANRFDFADRIMAESTRHNIGNVTRTINIPTLAVMFAHPRLRERFTFTLEGEEPVAGVTTQRVRYRESARPTLIKTTRGRDLLLEGRLWIVPDSGAIVRTELSAADAAVRAKVTVGFRRDDTLAIWVPEVMEEYYKNENSIDEVFATATYSNVRRFTVNTNEKLAKPPGAR